MQNDTPSSSVPQFGDLIDPGFEAFLDNRARLWSRACRMPWETLKWMPGFRQNALTEYNLQQQILKGNHHAPK